MSDAVTEAHELYQESLDALDDQRRQIEEDIRFSDPSEPEQWEDDLKRRREGDVGGRRPCLVMDQTGQYVANVAGQVEKQPPAIHAIPVGGGADKKAAEQIDGRFRHIEHESRAQQHYQRAQTLAARVGVGYITVRPFVFDHTLNYQEPRISSEPDALRVVLDPWSVELDGSDADFGFVLSPISVANFERRWPGKELCDFGDADYRHRDDNRKQIMVAEQWHKVTETRHMAVYMDDAGEKHSVTLEEYGALRDAQGNKPRMLGDPIKEKYQCVKWRLMSGREVLETHQDKNGKEAAYPADYIGIIPVYGYVGFKDGRMNYCGIPRRARGAQQAYNYHISEMQWYVATAPRMPWVASERALRGFETLWDKASVESRAFLPYNDIDEMGAIAPPSRPQLSLDFRNHESGAARALRDIQASVGMYSANIGANSNVTSGVAYDAQKEQGEDSTAHFPSHLAASVSHVGKIVMQMDAKLVDTKRRQPIIGVDLTPGEIRVDPRQKEAFMRDAEGVSINPTVGKYGVRVVVGASFSTQRKETNAAFTEMMRGNKDMVPVMAPFWAQTLDFPGSDKFAQAMVAMAPPAVKALMQPEGAEQEQDPAQMKQQMEQLQQALQEAVELAHQAQADADKAEREAADAKADNANDANEIEIKRFEANTKRLQVMGAAQEDMRAVAEKTVNEILAERLPETPMQGQQPQAVEQPMRAQPEVMPQPENDMNEQQMQAILESDSEIKELLMTLIDLQKKPRKKTAHRDPKTGYILHVTDEIEMPEGETLQ